MKERFIIMDVISSLYFSGLEWLPEPRFAEMFNSKDEALEFIAKESGKYMIIPVYVV